MSIRGEIAQQRALEEKRHREIRQREQNRIRHREREFQEIKSNLRELLIDVPYSEEGEIFKIPLNNGTDEELVIKFSQEYVDVRFVDDGPLQTVLSTMAHASVRRFGKLNEWSWHFLEQKEKLALALRESGWKDPEEETKSYIAPVNAWCNDGPDPLDFRGE